MKLKQLYVFMKVPANRMEKRIAEKEMEKINKLMLPFFYSYEKTTEEQRNLCNNSFVKECHRANIGNRFIQINPNSFMANTTTIEEELFSTNKINKTRQNAYLIIALILIIIAMSLLL